MLKSFWAPAELALLALRIVQLGSICGPISCPFGFHLRSYLGYIWDTFRVPKTCPFGGQFGIPNLSIWSSIWDPKPNPYRISNGGPKKDPKSGHLCNEMLVFGNPPALRPDATRCPSLSSDSSPYIFNLISSPHFRTSITLEGASRSHANPGYQK